MRKDLFVILVIICIATHIIRCIYEIMKHKCLLKPGKVSFGIMLTNMMLLWVSWFLLCGFDIFRLKLPFAVRNFGMLLSVAGVILFLIALSTIKTLENYEGDLITKGIYSKIRHPMYLGFIFWLIGFPVYYGAVISFFLAFLFIANVLFWRYLEELELVKRFPSYQEYKKKTFF
jgi:protein-S-isoprenylcysteine O-methyltransferase Ste14